MVHNLQLKVHSFLFSDFESTHFKLKKPYKRKGDQQHIEVLPGEEKIIVVRVKNDNPTELKWPPKISYKMIPLHWLIFALFIKSSTILANINEHKRAAKSSTKSCTFVLSRFWIKEPWGWLIKSDFFPVFLLYNNERFISRRRSEKDHLTF